MTGTGDVVTSLSCDRSYGIVYTECGGVETASVYKAFDSLGGDCAIDNDKLCNSLEAGEEPELGNMLMRAAISLCPRIAEVAEIYGKLGLRPNMTGSGSTVYALCDDPTREAERLNERGLRSGVAFTQEKGIVLQ